MIFYQELAKWWPLISPVEDYAAEAREFLRVIRGAAPGARSLLELGSGGGHNAHHLESHFQITLSDLSAEMLEVSKRLNPECEHIQGDMRTLDLGRSFDVVLIHDAIDYMTSEADLALAMATAYRHCRAGGIALLVPDTFLESFEPGTECGGSDGAEGEGVRYLEWSHDPDPSDTVGSVEYSFLVREVDGTVRSFHETHQFGLFSRATWLRLLERAGFEAEPIPEHTVEARTPRVFLLGRRPDAP